MKHLIVALLCLMLWGCARQIPPAVQETAPETTSASAENSLYAPGHPLENEYPGLIRAYPLTLRKVHGLRAFGKDLLALSRRDKTTLTVFSGEELRETACLTLDFHLQQRDPSLQIHGNHISFFDPEQRETVVLDHTLQVIRRIQAPDGLSGKPILSHDESTLFYCTGWSVVAWNLDSGIRRTVKELSYESQELTGLHLEDRILECQILDQGRAVKLLLEADQGTERAALPEDAQLCTAGDSFFATLTDGYLTVPVFGRADTVPELLLPEQDWQNLYYLPEDHAAVTVCQFGGGIRLDYYELSTGNLRSSLTLEASQTLKSIVNTEDHSVYILVNDAEPDSDTIYRWDVLRQPPDQSNTASYKEVYHSPEAPDTESLEQCREQARTIGEKYGITLRVWEDALAVQPWDYRFEPETLAPVLNKELQLLEQRLARYPAEVLRQSRSHFSGLTICLVRKITGTGDANSLQSATGIQFFEDNEAYVVIATGEYSEQALYHELYHVMETHILTESTALDTWDTLNPAGFAYGSEPEHADVYLQGQTRAFADRYSMVARKEDRARILENAMLPDKQELFRSEYMQRKLNAMCTGIREAYKLQKYPETLPWEQYLVMSLVPET